MKYNNTISYLKAYGIVLMVIGHCISGSMRDFIYMFHMPLFFFVSGYCFKRSYLCNWRLFIWKKTEGLYIPFVKWCIIFLILHNIFCQFHFFDINNNSHPISPLSNNEILQSFAIIVLLMRGQPPIIGAFWFLNALFWGAIISYAFLKIFKEPEYAAIGTLSICIITNYKEWQIPFIMISPQIFSAAFLIIVGHIFAFRKIKPLNIWQISIAMMALIIGEIFWKAEMSHAFYSTPRIIPYMTTAIGAIWAFYSIFIKLEDKLPNQLSIILLYIGNHTLIILALHFLVFKLVSIVIILIYDLPISRLADYPAIIDYGNKGWWVVYTIAGVVIPLSYIWCRKRIYQKYPSI